MPAGPRNKRPKSKLWASLIWTILPALAVFGAVLFWGVRAQNAVTYTLRGAAKEEKGDLDGALADYNQAIQVDPKYAAAYKDRANAKRKKGDLNGANADFSQARNLGSKSADLMEIPD